ncbi:HAD superfamily hydrolase (TIGR01549 family) [Streptosporangium becharense]|uniref:HAD superfamily hydrolase (TIGR01549 family) n=1 Tax=Streptosporangium becharense TaxID=1816182 RepID=A0A7W9IH80_9ACTN|nr:HAD family hydrolase [Streptosporangium becharense]MBB2914834.1 HAD superfamily hydrolase (TIGR01549 family) [Streptosporangium becharense]MBB5820355.1 HAD superfamily hydrolase (TIGR01549 family) [Streptosporangium becharense]
MVKTVVFDIGETLVRDDRYWGSWADWLNIPRHTLSALVGAVTALGMDNAEAIRLLRPDIDPRALRQAREEAGQGEYLDETDLYPDVRTGLQALRDTGFRVCVAGNQTRKAGDLLRGLSIPADVIVTSEEWGVAKPDPEFFGKVLQLAKTPAHETVYVGDHPANDILPAKLYGLRTCIIRRGPWGHLWGNDAATLSSVDWRIDSITELPSLLSES